MSVEIEEITSATHHLKLVLPSDDVGSEMTDIARGLTKKVSIPGFRKGKVPIDVVKRRFADEIRNDAVRSLVGAQVKRVLTEREISPIREPHIEDYTVDEQSSDYQVTVSYEVMPQIDDPSLNGEKVTKPVWSMSESDVDNILKKWQKLYAVWEAADRPVMQNDKVLAKILPMKDGSQLWESSQDVDFQIDEDEELSEVKEACIGKSKGDKFTVTCVYDIPAASADEPDTAQTETEKEEIEYSVEILKVEQPKAGELNEVIAGKLGISRMDHENFRKRAIEEIGKQIKSKCEHFLREHAVALLLKRNSFTPPESMVGLQAVKYLQMNGFSEEQIAREIDNQAESSLMHMTYMRAALDLKITMLLDKVQADRDIGFEDSEIDEYIQSNYGDDSQTGASTDNPEENLHVLNRVKQSRALEYRHRKLVDAILQDAEIEEVTMDTDAIDAWAESIRNPSPEPDGQMEEAGDETGESASQDSAEDVSIIVDALGRPIDKS